MRKFLLLFTFCLLSVSVHAQHSAARFSSNGISGKKSYNRKEKKPYFLNIRGGLTQFFGELNGQDMHTMAGVSVGRSVNKHFSIQVDFTAGKLGGEKADFFNSYFVNEYNTIECILKWDLTEQFNRIEPGPAHFFLYAGLGHIYFSSNAFDLDNNNLLRFSNSELSARNPLFLRWGPANGPTGIKKTREGALPLGTCLEYTLFQYMKIGVEYRFYLVRTDKMDATSGRRLINPEESESYSNTPNDKFGFLCFSMRYHFGKPN